MAVAAVAAAALTAGTTPRGEDRLLRLHRTPLVVATMQRVAAVAGDRLDWWDALALVRRDDDEPFPL